MNDEFERRIAEISATIAQLRERAGKDRRQLLDTLFRSVHSLKAAAHANGLKDLAARAHEFEDSLHAIRTGRASLDELPGFDPPPNTQIENMIPAEIRGSLKDEERYRLAECVAEGANVYLVETSFGVSDFDRQFQQLKQALDKTGEVIATAPKTEDGKINFRILYATRSDLYRILDQAVRAGRAVATATEKQVDFSIRVEASLDKTMCDALADPLLHLVRNAVDHGIESTGHVTIAATSDNNQTCIAVADNGRGIDPTIIESIFQPGFSTATEVTTFSGRGVGLDVVKTAIEELGGSIRVSSEPGKGSTFEIVLPF
ncbi:MAG TPA: ATP-binding protein [Pyrinomonadaceae bacterium]|jgi:chemotaxis protein histidine kinase CheA|nr:ATP-binding protein [Pyrinomonadaceae bacterium]